jgi:hypothetical protein
MDGFPHHTHIGTQSDHQASDVTTLEEALVIIQSRIGAV